MSALNLAGSTNGPTRLFLINTKAVLMCTRDASSWCILNLFQNSFLQSWCTVFTRSSTVYINRNYLTIFSYALRHSFNHLSIWMTSIWIQSSIFSCSFRCVICCTQAKQDVWVFIESVL
jgi:hypothetical protein